MSLASASPQKQCNSGTLEKQTAKLTPVWELGLWLGRDTLANEVLVGTPTGVKLVRSIRRLVPSEKYSKTLFDTVKGTPWSLRGDGLFQPLTVTQTPAQAGVSTPSASTAPLPPQQQATSEIQAEEQQPPLPAAAPQPTTTTAMDTTTSTVLAPAPPSALAPVTPTGPASTTKRDFAQPQQPQERPGNNYDSLSQLETNEQQLTLQLTQTSHLTTLYSNNSSLDGSQLSHSALEKSCEFPSTRILSLHLRCMSHPTSTTHG